LLNLDNFTAFVKAALGTHPMLHARLLTVRAHNGLGRAQRIVCATLAGAGF